MNMKKVIYLLTFISFLVLPFQVFAALPVKSTSVKAAKIQKPPIISQQQNQVKRPVTAPVIKDPGDKVNSGERIVVPGVRIAIGTGFGNQTLEVKILRIIGENLVHIVEILLVVIKVFGVFVPGNEIKTAFKSHPNNAYKPKFGKGELMPDFGFQSAADSPT